MRRRCRIPLKLMQVGLCLSCMMVACGGLQAQETTDHSAASPGSSNQERSVDVKNELARIRQLTDRVLENRQDEPIENSAEPGDPDERLSDFMRQQQDVTEETNELFNQLRNRLNRMMQQHALAEAKANRETELAGSNQRAVDHSPASTAIGENLPSELENHVHNSESAPEKAQPDPVTAEPLPPSQILAKPVDQLALADSLYRLEELQLATDLYQKLLDHGSAEDRIWIEFQLAACLRKAGQYDEASSHLRKVVNSTDEHLATHARWWLQQIETRSIIEQNLQELDTIIKNLDQQE